MPMHLVSRLAVELSVAVVVVVAHRAHIKAGDIDTYHPDHHHDHAPPALTFFGPSHDNQVVVNATLLAQQGNSTGPGWTAESCAQSCLSFNGGDGCIAFSISSGSPPEADWCNLSGWATTYAVVSYGSSATRSRSGSEPVTVNGNSGTAAYYFRKLRIDKTPVQPVVSYTLDVPDTGVYLAANTAFRAAYDANVQYLLGYAVDDMLYWFRKRAGVAEPPGQSWGWDNGMVDKPYGLRGSVAGTFLMGTGGSLRWQKPQQQKQQVQRQFDASSFATATSDDNELQSMLRSVVEGIADNVVKEGDTTGSVLKRWWCCMCVWSWRWTDTDVFLSHTMNDVQVRYGVPRQRVPHARESQLRDVMGDSRFAGSRSRTTRAVRSGSGVAAR